MPGRVGDNGYAFEEVILGGRLFIRQGTKRFTEVFYYRWGLNFLLFGDKRS